MNLAQIWSERRKIILLTLLAVLLTIILARQADWIPPGPAGRVVRTIVSPLVAAVGGVDRAVSYSWLILFRARGLEAENRDLRQELALLRVRYQQLAEAHARVERLSGLTARWPTFNMPNVTANIVGLSANFWTRSVTIDRGRRDGIGPNMPVVNQDGLVGIVRDATDNDALVQLLTDPEFAAGALVSDSRDRGVIEGTGRPDRLLLVLENPQTSVREGAQVMTSGLPVGSLFPKGFVIGTIAGIEQSKFGQPYVVKPTVRFDRLEEVVVLLEPRRGELPPQQVPIPPP
jgi:rod shape-determining protein MreC